MRQNNNSPSLLNRECVSEPNSLKVCSIIAISHIVIHGRVCSLKLFHLIHCKLTSAIKLFSLLIRILIFHPTVPSGLKNFRWLMATQLKQTPWWKATYVLLTLASHNKSTPEIFTSAEFSFPPSKDLSIYFLHCSRRQLIRFRDSEVRLWLTIIG